jgi:hypothetical protein
MNDIYRQREARMIMSSRSQNYNLGTEVITDEIVQAATQAFAGKLCEDREKGITQHHKAMRAALQAVEPMLVGVPDGWKLIETAPKDGRYMLLWRINRQPFSGRYEDGEWLDPMNLCRDPSHWMPLPAAPEPDIS